MVFFDGILAGCCHLLLNSSYPFFRDKNIPEINDLSVFPEFRRRGIASFDLQLSVNKNMFRLPIR
ncbi:MULTISPECIES: GNAT family N-acetyltransferase [Paenibacillus]|nr:GNAT family N-acetyltransferase [Paenibacillus lautus]